MDQSDALMWAGIVGFFSPLLIAVVQQPSWPSWLRGFVTFVYSIIAGAGTAYFADAFTGKTFVSCILIVLVTAIGTYKGIWQYGPAPRIEEKTALPKQ